MPKGDRQKLKADPEDGTTPVANLLLEAIAMAKLSGLEARIIVCLCRQTYGWVVDGKRLKEKKITLTEWQYALDSSKSRVSAALKGLEAKNIIHRRIADPWGGYYYTLNTNIRSWNSNSVNLARLSEMVTVAHFGTVVKDKTVAKSGTVAQNENSSPRKDGTVAQNGTEQLPKTEPPTLYKEILKKDKEKDEANIFKIYEDEIGKITPMVAEKLKDLEKQYPISDIADAIKEAVKSNARNFRYIEKILENWKREGRKQPRGQMRSRPSRYEDGTGAAARGKKTK